MLGRASLLFGTIVVTTAFGAFTAVRAWFVPLGAAANAAHLTVDTQPTGAELLIDNQPHGSTPQTLTIAPGVHTIVVRSGAAERTAQLTLAGGAQSSQYFDLEPYPTTAPKSSTTEVVFSLPPSQAPLGGWLTVAAPFPVDVIERGELLGTSGNSRTMLAAGSHELVLRNERVGYERRHRIEVTAGKVTTLKVVAPDGALSVNARPWADVLIDGVSVGQTPLANLRVAAGSHQIIFRHPQFGERRETVLISTKAVTRLAVDLAK